MKRLTTGKLAKLANVNIETVRYYERQKLLPMPSKNKSGYREYTQEYVGLIKFIKRAKRYGFSLKEIKELINTKNDPGTTCGDIKTKVDSKIDEISEEVELLQEIKQSLIKLSKKKDWLIS